MSEYSGETNRFDRLREALIRQMLSGIKTDQGLGPGMSLPQHIKDLQSGVNTGNSDPRRDFGYGPFSGNPNPPSSGDLRKGFGYGPYSGNPNPAIPRPEPTRDLNAEAMAQINAILGKPDIPGHWISPYSQDQLNNIGSGLEGAGKQAASAYDQAKQEIIDNYQRSQAVAQQSRSDLFNPLMQGLNNLGVNAGASAPVQQSQSDFARLQQVAGLNQTTDTAYTDKLSAMTQSLATQLAEQARQGLLTPKQYVGPQSGLTDADKIKVDILRDQMAGKSTEDLMNELVSARATETQKQDYPELAAALAKLTDPKLKDRALSAYELGGGTPEGALKYLNELDTPRAPVNLIPNSFSNIPLFGPALGRATSNINTAFTNAIQPRVDEENAVRDALISLFRQYAPIYAGTTTNRTVTTTGKSS